MQRIQFESDAEFSFELLDNSFPVLSSEPLITSFLLFISNAHT